MATSVDTQPKQRYADFDEYVDYQIRKTRQNVKTTDIVTAAVGVLTLVLGYLLVFVLLDHWGIPGGFSNGARIGMLSALAVAALAWIVWKLIVPSLKQVTSLYAAQALETASPELRGGLLNLVDLRSANREVSPVIMESLEKQAAITLAHADVDQAIDRTPLLRLSYALLAIVVLSCMYGVFSPKRIAPSLWRALAPASSVSVATRTQIVSVIPGDLYAGATVRMRSNDGEEVGTVQTVNKEAGTIEVVRPGSSRPQSRRIDDVVDVWQEVLARTKLKVTANLQGELPERVLLYYTTADRRFVDESIEMRQPDSQIKVFQAMLDGENGNGILQDLTYYVAAGDAVSEAYRVKVIQPPSARVESMHYDYLDYTGLEDRTQPGGDVDVWDGTKVTFFATANMPIKSAELVFSESENASERTFVVPMEVDGTKLVNSSKAWHATIDANDGTYPHFYRIECKNLKGESDPHPTLYSVTIRPDKKPVVELLSPVTDLEMPANGIVPLLIRAHDPDFLLGSILLQTEKNGTRLDGFAPLIFRGDTQSFQGTYEFDLSRLNLAKGDVITYWIEAWDNRPQSANSPRLNIKIIDRVSKEQVQEQLQEGKQKQEQLAEKLRQQNNTAGDDQQPPLDNPQEPPKDGTANEDKQSEPKPNGKQPEQQNSDREKTGDSGAPASKSDPVNGSTAKSEQERLDPNGADDDEVLKKLIERNQQSQAKQDGQPGKEPPQDGSKQEPKPNTPPNPKTGEPKSGEPKSGEPKSGDPKTGDPKTGEPKTGEPKTGEPKSGEPKTGEPKSGEPKTGEPKTGEPKTGEPKTGEPKTGEPKTGEPKTGEPKTGEPKTGEPKSGEPRSGEAKPGDPKTGEPKSGDPKTGEPKTGEPKTGESKSGEAKPGDPKTGDPKTGEPKSGDPKTGEPKSGDPKTGEPKTGEPKSGAPKSGESKPGDPKSGESKPGDPKAGDPKSGESKPGDPKSGESKTGDPKSGEPKSGEPKAGDPKAGDPKAGDPKSGESKPGDPKSGESKPGDPKAGDPKDGESKSGESKPGESKPEQNGGSKSDESGSGKSQGEGKDGDGQGNRTGAESKSGASGEKPGGAAADRGAAQQKKAAGGQGGGDGSEGPDPEAANLEYTRKAADLALNRLQKDLERGEVDEQLLKDLGWTDDELKKFADRMQQQLGDASQDQSREAVARRRQFEEMLKSLDLNSKGARRTETELRQRSDGGVGPRRAPVPAEYRDAFEAYTKSVSKRTTTDPPPAPKR